MDNIQTDGCLAGFWGVDCKKKCTADLCATVSSDDGGYIGITCEKHTGNTIQCQTCKGARWGDVCEFECKGSEHCDASRPIMCNKVDGLALRCDACQFGWTGAGCDTKIACPPLEILDSHLHTECPAGRPVALNDTCAFRCSPGHEMLGPFQISCNSGISNDGVGVWSANVPTCIAKPCDTVTGVPLGLPCSGHVVTGDYCHPQPASPGVVCLGSWECVGQEGLDHSRLVPVADFPPRCLATGDCDACDPNADCVTINLDPTCVCRPGYWGSGQRCQRCTQCARGYEAVVTCGLSERPPNTTLEYFHLSSHDAVCKDIDECQRPCLGPTDTGCHRCAHNCHNQPGYFTCSCRDGYRLDGDDYGCTLIQCGTKSISNSRKVCAGGVGSRCTFDRREDCLSGYTGFGSLVCNANGEWTGDAVCLPKQCGIIDFPHIDPARPCQEHGLPWDSSLVADVHSRCTINCEKGYHATGTRDMACSPCGLDSVKWTTETRCEPNTCRPFLVDVSLGVTCQDIATGQACVGGAHFQCPPGYSAAGSAVCGPDGLLVPDKTSPPRCVKDSNTAALSACASNPCGPGGVCLPAHSNHSGSSGSPTYICRCADPYVQSRDQLHCILECPPPSAMNEARTECVYPPGFRRVLFSPDAPPSAVMVGQKDIPRAFRPFETRCERIGYSQHYIWDIDHLPLHLIVSVHHPNGHVHGNPYTEKESVVDGTGNPPIVYWVENATSGYFTFCFTEVKAGVVEGPHEKITVNYLAFSHVFGAEYGEAPVDHVTYRVAKGSSRNIDRFTGLTSFQQPPLVLTSLVHGPVGDDGFCDPVHCVCDPAIHNGGHVMANDVFSNVIGLSYRELPRYRKKSGRELVVDISKGLCGTNSCFRCPPPPTPASEDQPSALEPDLRDICLHRVREAVASHDEVWCSQGRDARVSWFALAPRQTSAVMTGTTALKYERMNLNAFLAGAVCEFVSFGGRFLTNPVVFASLNHRTGANYGSLTEGSEAVLAWHMEGVDTSGFRICYMPVLDRADQQPSTQNEYVNVDWVVFHD